MTATKTATKEQVIARIKAKAIREFIEEIENSSAFMWGGKGGAKFLAVRRAIILERDARDET